MTLDERLDPGEWFIFAARPHWIRFLPAGLLAAVAAGLFAFLGWRLVPALAWALAVAVALPLLVQRFRWDFVVTNRRLILDYSFLRPRVVSLPLQSVAEIVLELDKMGRWANTARVRVRGVDGRSYAVPFLSRARLFRRLALEQRLLCLHAASVPG